MTSACRLQVEVQQEEEQRCRSHDTSAPGSPLEIFRLDGRQSLQTDHFFVRQRAFPVIDENFLPLHDGGCQAIVAD